LRGILHIVRSRAALAALIATVTVAGFVLVAREVGAGVMEAASTPSWGYLIAAFAVWAGVQPLRAWAWATTLRAPVGFRAVYAASAIGSFLDTVLPGRLGEVSKVAALKVAAGPAWPGLPRAGGSLLAMHLLEASAFALVGAASAFFLPIPSWARWILVGGCLAAVGGIALAASVRSRLRLPHSVDAFLAGAAAPPRVLAKAGVILIGTWIVRWAGVFLLLHAVGVKAGLGAALVYLVVTGLANVAPLLPGNVGVYQGAALGALAMVGHAGAQAVAVSLLAPAIVSVAFAAAALVALALFGTRSLDVSRAALARP
jgi:uncharacterized membrane protein YbhN (UPF0104 family)